jgi:enoyl-[acyl-carrier protein] reductase II
MPLPALKATIDSVRAGAGRPFNVNFITSLTETAQVDVACNEGVPVVSFHWGHPPRSWIDALRGCMTRAVGNAPPSTRGGGSDR